MIRHVLRDLPRRSTPPSPAKAMRYRIRHELRAIAADCVVPALIAGPLAMGAVVYLTIHH